MQKKIIPLNYLLLGRICRVLYRILAILILSLSAVSRADFANRITDHQQWIETNGLGSVIAGQVNLANSSKYHGILVTVNSKGERITLINNLEAWVQDEVGVQFPLSSNHYAKSVVFPEGQKYLTQFESYPWPKWTWVFSNGIKIERELVFLFGTDQVVVRYRSLSPSKHFKLVLRPLASSRSFFHVRRDYGGIALKATEKTSSPSGFQKVRFQPYFNMPSLSIHHNGKWIDQNIWFYNQTYSQNSVRLEDDTEHLWSPGEIEYSLGDQSPIADLVLETDPSPQNANKVFLPEINSNPVDQALMQERTRRDQINASIISGDNRIKYLAFSSEQYLFKRPDNLQSVLAGFPWFLDWGRDTLISLEGFLMQKGRLDEAFSILKTFASFETKGVLPNMFPTLGSTPAYNTVDASLWFIHASQKWLDYGGSHELFKKHLWPSMRNVLDYYIAGTSYHIKADSKDGLIWAGEEGLQLTWMDAKVDDFVVTPRRGKPVEINALWYRALKIGVALSEKFDGDIHQKQLWMSYLDKVQNNFSRKFFDEHSGALRDAVDGPDFQDEFRLRPNGLYVLALSPELLSPAQAQKALLKIEENLKTPYGFRSLAPYDPSYKGKYDGDIWARDLAYHQGTVWAFLVGVYADAVLNVRGHTKEQHQYLTEYLQPLIDHSVNATLGHINEIYWGNAPYTPAGCWAQAWSDAEVLRVLYKLNLVRYINNK